MNSNRTFFYYYLQLSPMNQSPNVLLNIYCVFVSLAFFIGDLPRNGCCRLRAGMPAKCLLPAGFLGDEMGFRAQQRGDWVSCN